MIATERLILREWRDGDAEPFAAMCRSPAVTRYLGDPQTDDEIATTIARIRRRYVDFGFGRWSVERVADARFIGLCGLVPFDRPDTPVHGEIEIGWQLTEAAWGRGYAREAAAASLAWGWDNLSAPRIVAITVPANTVSWRLMERLGMARRRDWDFAHPNFAEGHPLRRHIAYSIDRPERRGDAVPSAAALG